MNRPIQDIMSETLALPTELRAFLAEKLLESLDFEEPFELSPEWRDEIQKRIQSIQNGSAQFVAAEEVFDEIRKKLRK